MIVDYDTLLRWPITNTTQSYSERDAILYALGIGLGTNPTDPQQLRYVYEKELKTIPTFALTLGLQRPFFTDPRLGLDHLKLINLGVGAVFYRQIPTSGSVVVSWSILNAFDKGDRGALILVKRTIDSQADGQTLCEVTSTYLFRNDGHFGGSSGPAATPHQIPHRPPDEIVEFPTMPQAALIYRLSGDLSPLHVDPGAAKAAGFERPILHGLCSLGITAYVVLSTVGARLGGRLATHEARFSAPFYPGETLRIELWSQGQTVSFRASSRERGIVSIDNGRAELAL